MSELLAWLNGPIDSGRIHDVRALVSWHGRIMFLAWGVIAPLAVIIARYFKITPRQKWPEELDNTFWWNCHRFGQIFALLLTGFGFMLILRAGSTGEATLHHLFGYSVIALGLAQGISGIFRGTKGGPTYPAPDGSYRGDHYDMTTKRLIFEYFHKIVGMVTIFLGLTAILQGLWAANAPKWMWILICGWWLLLIIAVIWLQIYRGSADTYQAIWGPDPSHPGNRMRQYGWGTFRPGDRDDRSQK